MKLKKILENIDVLETKGDLEIDITNISSDSRKIFEGGMFFAIKGFTLDGTKFISQAIEKGAKAIVVESDFDIKNAKDDATYIKVQNIRKTLALAACNLNDNPSKKLKVIGVTGTKGKTTSTFMIKSILEKHGYKVGLIRKYCSLHWR